MNRVFEFPPDMHLDLDCYKILIKSVDIGFIEIKQKIKK